MKTKKQLEAENFILGILFFIFFVMSFVAAISCIHYKLEPQEECEKCEECMDEYWENEYKTIKRLYDFDEALLLHGEKIDEITWKLPLEYAPEF